VSYYQMGLSVESNLPVRVNNLIEGVTDFHHGARHFHRNELIGAASGTPFGTLADGITAIILDGVHVLLMIGGFMFLLRAIFPV
jgi:hypothetical protein